MEFTKMQGAGNDYIYLDCTRMEIANPSEMAVKLSDRHFGIGADGLILIKKSATQDFLMEMYNADGSQAQMCGNGIRCVGKYVYDNGLTNQTTITVETLAGAKTLKLHPGEDGTIRTVTVNMGKPILKADLIPVNPAGLCSYTHKKKPSMIPASICASDCVLSEKIEVLGKIYQVTCISMGNPHAVIYLDDNVDIRKLDIETIGPAFEGHPAFPERINTEFIQVVDRQNLNMRVWERGSGETLACGTGACAAFVATVMNGLCDSTAMLHLLGGDLKIVWELESGEVFMDGPAETVFKGNIQI